MNAFRRIWDFIGRHDDTIMGLVPIALVIIWALVLLSINMQINAALYGGN